MTKTNREYRSGRDAEGSSNDLLDIISQYVPERTK